jgi:hypothetical protein
MKNRDSNVRVWLGRKSTRKVRANEALAAIARARRIFPEPDKAGHHLNDDKSPLIDLLNCIVCRKKMKIEKSSPDAEGRDIIQYRCEQCHGIERVRLLRRSRDAS